MPTTQAILAKETYNDQIVRLFLLGAAVWGIAGMSIGVYAAVLRAQGMPLSFPGGAPRVSEAVDADLLARAIDWAGTSEAASAAA